MYNDEVDFPGRVCRVSLRVRDGSATPISAGVAVHGTVRFAVRAGVGLRRYTALRDVLPVAEDLDLRQREGLILPRKGNVHVSSIDRLLGVCDARPGNKKSGESGCPVH